MKHLNGKSKRLLIILLGLLFIVFATSWWYFRIRIPNDYGQLYYSQSNLSTTDRYIPSQLFFNGHTYVNISNTVLGRSVDWGAATLGKVKTDPKESDPIVIWSVFMHPDLVLVINTTDMAGWSAVFQEEK